MLAGVERDHRACKSSIENSKNVSDHLQYLSFVAAKQDYRSLFSTTIVGLSFIRLEINDNLMTKKQPKKKTTSKVSLHDHKTV